MSQKTYDYPYCGCIFFTSMDLYLHTEAFGEGPDHAAKVKHLHEKLEWGQQ